MPRPRPTGAEERGTVATSAIEEIDTHRRPRAARACRPSKRPGWDGTSGRSVVARPAPAPAAGRAHLLVALRQERRERRVRRERAPHARESPGTRSERQHRVAHRRGQPGLSLRRLHPDREPEPDVELRDPRRRRRPVTRMQSAQVQGYGAPTPQNSASGDALSSASSPRSVPIAAPAASIGFGRLSADCACPDGASKELRLPSRPGHEPRAPRVGSAITTPSASGPARARRRRLLPLPPR